jgi:AcrR family transcriptional regulator
MPAKGQKRKQQIINTAKDMFIQNGFQSTHIGQVCEKLNIARGTVYQYFGNKREIMYTVLEQVEENINDILDPDDLKEFLKTNPSQKMILKYVGDALTQCIKVILDEKIVMKLIYKDIVGIDNEVIDRVNKFLINVISVVAKNLEEITKKGLSRKNLDSQITAMTFVGSIMFVLYQYDHENKNPLDKDLVDNLVTNIMSGIMK